MSLLTHRRAGGNIANGRMDIGHEEFGERETG